jgi:hypothetical protein
MLRILQTLIVALLLMPIALIAKPTKPPTQPEAKAAPTIPTIPAITNWGYCVQKGKEFKLTGDLEWSAEGKFTDDGRVFILWLELETGEMAHSVYVASSVEGKLQLQGTWAYVQESELKDGVLFGNIREDVVHQVDSLELPD